MSMTTMHGLNSAILETWEITKILIVWGLIGLPFILSGCLATTHRIGFYELLVMQPDCANKDAQIRYLHAQIGRSGDVSLAESFQTNGYKIRNFIGGNPQVRNTNSSNIDKFWYEGRAKKIIWMLRSNCD